MFEKKMTAELRALRMVLIQRRHGRVRGREPA